MPSSRIHHLRIQTREGQLEEALRTCARPLWVELGRAHQLDASFFARYQSEILLFIAGEPAWIDHEARPRVAEHLARARSAGLVTDGVECAYQPEVERYGGEEGMRLAERIFHVDSLACLALIDVAARGNADRSRREVSLVLTERLLDLLRFDRAARVAFYRHSFAWTLEQGHWNDDDLKILDSRFLTLREGLAALAATSDMDEACGGAEAGGIVRDWLEAMAPLARELLDAHAAGRIAQPLVPLAWSYTHMQCNRLGIPADAEAIVRYFMYRLYEGDGP